MHCLLAVTIAVITLSAAQARDSVPAGGPVSEKCPVEYKGECFRMFRSSAAWTRSAGEKFCRQLSISGQGENGHLADIGDKALFDKVVTYLLTQKKEVDPNVLLGMRYEGGFGKEGTMYEHDGKTKIESAYWGAGRPLSWGDNMVIRASEKSLKSNKLQNMGGPETRYIRILCQFTLK